MSDIKLYCDDCFNILSNIEKNTVDLILVDLPYDVSRKSGFANTKNEDYIAKYGNLKIDFGEWDTKLDLHTLMEHFYRILKPNGTLICFYDCWKMQELKEIADKLKFKQPRLCCWQKTNPVPVNSNLNYLSNAKEYFATFVKQSKPVFNSKYDNGDYFIPVNEETDTYFYPIVHGKERTKHPTQKPEKLMEELILKHSNEGMLVLDCFMGSGTTGVACQNTGRNFIGIEKEQEYFDIAKQRILNSKENNNA